MLLKINMAQPLRIIVTGGAGFIGSNLIRFLLQQTGMCVLNIDKLVFPGSRHTIRDLEKLPRDRYEFSQTDICDHVSINRLFNDFRPDAVMHLAAESHVDRSIDSPDTFIHSNINGTYSLLQAARRYWSNLSKSKQDHFRFHHVSTDEVFGSLPFDESKFHEQTPYAPNSPYSASKAASDHLARTWHHTYGLPVVLSNCSNNYGPWQFPEKLIPLMITKAIRGEKLPVYGDGKNIRDWLFVEDHVNALLQVLQHGRIGESYNIGGNCEKSNNDVVAAICILLDELLPDSPCRPHHQLITFVTDRPGHDKRYAMDSSKISAELKWKPEYDFVRGLRETVLWYLQNQDWCTLVTDQAYTGERLGLNNT